MPHPDADELSSRLRALREAAGPGGDRMTQVDAAARSGLSQPMIAKFERGKLVPRPEQVTKLLDAYGVPARKPARRELLAMAEDLRPRVQRVVLSRDYASVQKRIGSIVRGSRVVRGFSPTVPPGMLQTRDFIVALFGGDQDAAAERIRTQDALDDTGRRFEYLLTEGALGGTVLPPEPAAAQLDHIAALSRRPNVRLGIVPFGAPLPQVPVHSWEIYDERAVIAGTVTGNVTIVDSPDVARYLAQFGALASVAAFDDDARMILTDNADRYRARA